MLEDMFYLFLSKIVRTEPVYNGRPKRNRLYSLCLSLCVCVCVFGARGRGEVHALKLSRERAASTGQTQTTEGGWSRRSALTNGRGTVLAEDSQWKAVGEGRFQEFSLVRTVHVNEPTMLQHLETF